MFIIYYLGLLVATSIVSVCSGSGIMMMYILDEFKHGKKVDFNAF